MLLAKTVKSVAVALYNRYRRLRYLSRCNKILPKEYVNGWSYAGGKTGASFG